MAYLLNYSLGTIIVNDQTLNTQTSLTIPGFEAAFYGQPVDQNQISLLENFASANVVTGPVNPVPGQLWYDRSTKFLKVNTSVNNTPVWIKVGPDIPIGGANGQVQYNNNGNFGGNSGFTYNQTTNTLTVGNSIAATAVIGNLNSNNINAGNFTASGNSNLGPVGKVTITGGTAGQVLTTNGSGVLSWRTGAYGNADVAVYLSSGTVTTDIITTANVIATSFNAPGADLAEQYVADADYQPGTVVEFGGQYEVTLATEGTSAVAGIVSTKPGYIMNLDCTGNHVIILALQGRVPCRVTGTVRKGDMMISAGNGMAKASKSPSIGTVIGKAIEDFDGDSGVIEVVAGRL
jgi:hypothetical protein